jgi:heme oxygenase
MIEEKYREELKRLMLKEEMREHLLTEADRIKNMNASPEDFADYLLKHNLWVTKENYAEFC